MESTKNLAQDIHALFIEDIERRLFVESIPRIRLCLDQLNEDQIWWKPNQHSNSIGNLVLHLIGNLGQYVLHGIGKYPDIRNRPQEFLQESRIAKMDLLLMLTPLETNLKKVIGGITPEDLIKGVSVQGFDESITSILIHVTEHLSYHTGQIAMRTKELKNIDLGFYAGLDLNITS